MGKVSKIRGRKANQRLKKLVGGWCSGLNKLGESVVGPRSNAFISVCA